MINIKTSKTTFLARHIAPCTEKIVGVELGPIVIEQRIYAKHNNHFNSSTDIFIRKGDADEFFW